MRHKNYFVTAIGTDCGKTVASAILCNALQADYWKPVQAGQPADTEWVREMIPYTCHQEAFFLKNASSPHYAAEMENVQISVTSLKFPETNRPLVIEGAGGLLVPVNQKEKMIDLADHFNAHVILVCNIYLGSINHSLLSIDYLERSGLPVAGIIFNGMETPSTEEIITNHSPWPVLVKIRPEKVLDQNVIARYGSQVLLS